MQVTYIGLSEYYKRCIQKAKENNFILIVSLIARYSDAPEIYEKLEADWASLNDLTSNKILFVFSTPKIREKASFFHLSSKKPYEGVMCPFVELLDGKGIEDSNGPFEFLYDDYKKVNWKQRHSQTITQFAKDYNISEGQIPCLFLYDLGNDRHKVIPISPSTNLYELIKYTVKAMDEYGVRNIEPILDNFSAIKFTSGKSSIDSIVADLITACVMLQANSHYSTASEDQRNDYIRDMLKMAEYEVHDQTRRGMSYAGKNAGEVDIFIEDNGLPVTIIEALNLDSMNTSYLDKHIDKVYRYDTTGNAFNIVLSYVQVADFERFCKKYFEHVSKRTYTFPLISVEKDCLNEESKFSNICVMKTVHNRHGFNTSLYHVCVLIE